jgi:transcription elongation GreA/GreB family factor
MERKMDKNTVVEAFRTVLTEELSAVERVAAMARDEVSSEETRQEGKYDTRATEASYLARGQAWRVAELRRLKAWFDVFDAGKPGSESIGVGSLVQLDGPRSGWVFVAPIGGPKAEVDGVSIRLISLRSPLGAAMVDFEADDVFEVHSPSGTVEYEVRAVL